MSERYGKWKLVDVKAGDIEAGEFVVAKNKRNGTEVGAVYGYTDNMELIVNLYDAHPATPHIIPAAQCTLVNPLTMVQVQ